MQDDDDNKKGDPGNGQAPFDFKKNRFGLILFLVVAALLVTLYFTSENTEYTEIEYSTFISKLESGDISSVTILDHREIQGIYVDPNSRREPGSRYESSSGSAATYPFVTKIPYADPELLKLLKDKNVSVKGGQKSLSPFAIIMDYLPFLLGFIIIFFLFRQMQGGSGKAFGFGKSKAKKYDEKGKRVTFADVAGQEEAKYELQEVVEFLKSPGKFLEIGAKIPKGVLLVGSPGTGKTLLAKAVAGEAGVNFFHMSGSDFVEMFVGVGASRVRDLFEQGRKMAPSILFIDEIDAVGRTRGAGYGGGHDEREQTLNQLLVEMDGFDTKDSVIVIAATNRPDVLDTALLRPGRFDRQVVVSLPDVKERKAILTIHAKKVKLDTSVDLEKVARATAGSSGADLANLVNEAALYAARKGREAVDSTDFEEARDKMLMGAAKHSRIISPKDKLATAYHEAGHALLHYYLKDADPLHKVTVIPRGRALGVAFSLPEQDRYTLKKGWVLDRIKISFGGYAAEELIYGETTSGVVSDLQQATGLARRMVTEWGMSEKVGLMALSSDEPIFIGRDISSHKDYSENTARAIDEEVKSILDRCMSEVRSILAEHKDQLIQLAELLVQKETLDDKEIRSALSLPPPQNAPGEMEI